LAKGEGKEFRDALFHYLLIRAYCQRTGKSEVHDLANSGLKLYAGLIKPRREVPPIEVQGSTIQQRKGA
jgi:hypothetical protein